MRLSAIKKLVDFAVTKDLILAREALLSGTLPAIEIDGEDEGEQLTHVLATLFIQNEMRQKELDYVSALRIFLFKVRESVRLT